MKKYLVLGVLFLMLPLFVYAADKSTTLSYMVGEEKSYEWSVPASVTVSSVVTTNNMQQKPGHSATIYVTASNVKLQPGYQLVVYYPEGMRSLKNGNSSIPYYIDEGKGDGVWTGELATVEENNDVVLRVQQNTGSATAPILITVYEDDIEAATALGEHTDTITFTAEVILND